MTLLVIILIISFLLLILCTIIGIGVLKIFLEKNKEISTLKELLSYYNKLLVKKAGLDFDDFVDHPYK